MKSIAPKAPVSQSRWHLKRVVQSWTRVASPADVKRLAPVVGLSKSDDSGFGDKGECRGSCFGKMSKSHPKALRPPKLWDLGSSICWTWHPCLLCVIPILHAKTRIIQMTGDVEVAWGLRNSRCESQQWGVSLKIGNPMPHALYYSWKHHASTLERFSSGYLLLLVLFDFQSNLHDNFDRGVTSTVFSPAVKQQPGLVKKNPADWQMEVSENRLNP